VCSCDLGAVTAAVLYLLVAVVAVALIALIPWLPIRIFPPRAVA